jgi:predicted nucleic acid-binding Zn ribbon protein
MTENKENTETTEKTLSKEEKKKKRKRYALFMSVILILVVFVDSYTTSLPNTLQPAVATDFLGGFSVNEQNAILAIGSAIFSLGLWFVFFF